MASCCIDSLSCSIVTASVDTSSASALFAEDGVAFILLMSGNLLFAAIHVWLPATLARARAPAPHVPRWVAVGGLGAPERGQWMEEGEWSRLRGGRRGWWRWSAS